MCLLLGPTNLLLARLTVGLLVRRTISVWAMSLWPAGPRTIIPVVVRWGLLVGVPITVAPSLCLPARLSGPPLEPCLVMCRLFIMTSHGKSGKERGGPLYGPLGAGALSRNSYGRNSYGVGREVVVTATPTRPIRTRGEG